MDDDQDSTFQETDDELSSLWSGSRNYCRITSAWWRAALSHALFVFGAQGGLGKTRTITRTLEEEGVDYALQNSHCTPLSLFSLLFQYRDDAVIVFDDVDSMFSSMAHLGLLRSALWGSPRIVTYGSSQLPRDLPPRFETTARFIFAANVIPKKNDAFGAMLSRCDIYELSATNSEVIDLMRSVSANGFRGITPEECAMVIDFISDNSEDLQLSMRLLGPSLAEVGVCPSGAKAGLETARSITTPNSRQEANDHQTTRRQIPGQQKCSGKPCGMFPDAVKAQQAVFWCQKTGQVAGRVSTEPCRRHKDETRRLRKTDKSDQPQRPLENTTMNQQRHPERRYPSARCPFNLRLVGVFHTSRAAANRHRRAQARRTLPLRMVRCDWAAEGQDFGPAK